jgi:hypothetical protein
MCIIVVIPYGEKIPSKKVFKTCAENNKDGMGFMYRKNNVVKIKKGYFNVDQFYNDVKKIKNSEICLHFRYSTHGKISAGNCHPFPLSNDVNDLTNTKIDCEIGIAHNGIISGMTVDTDLSDTMVFIRDLVVDNVKEIPQKVNTIDGKFLIMSKYKTYLIGNFVYDSGIYYSNDGYKKVTPVYTTTKYNCIIDPFIEGSEMCEYCKYQYINNTVVNDPCLDCDGMCNFSLSENKEDQMNFMESEYSYYYDDEEIFNALTKKETAKKINDDQIQWGCF